MNNKTLVGAGTRILFGNALHDYERSIERIIGATRAFKDLRDPIVVLDCLADIERETNELVLKWTQLMMENQPTEDPPQKPTLKEGMERVIDFQKAVLKVLEQNSDD